MEWMGTELTPLWDYLQKNERTVVLYGMGNGADKILSVCEKKGIPVCEVFASDGFVRNKLFHGMPVRSWSDVKAQYGAQNLTVLLSFASSLPDVLDNITRISRETELFAPDVPVFGNTLFDARFLEENRQALLSARALLSDAESQRIFDLVIRYKVTGRIEPLLLARNDPLAVMRELVEPTSVRVAADLGAYNGDTVRELLNAGARPEQILAFEPDARNFRKLSDYAAQETRTKVSPVRAAAWSCTDTLVFDAGGNRNASVTQNRSSVLKDRPIKLTELPALPLDALTENIRLDYIKYDVEGSEQAALIGSAQTIARSYPTLLVSLYHRSEDIFSLPLQIHQAFPAYKGFYLRRFGGIPAWDLNLYVKKETPHELHDHRLLP